MTSQQRRDLDARRWLDARLSRRGLLRSLMAAGLVGPALAACGGKTSKGTGTGLQQAPAPSGA
ncbi:MAG: hypothetical protein ACR2PL_04960, partial [Dehalococcoidia bacterium]